MDSTLHPDLILVHKYNYVQNIAKVVKMKT